MYRVRIYLDNKEDSSSLLRFEGYIDDGIIWSRIRWLSSLYTKHRIEIIPVEFIPRGKHYENRKNTEESSA